MRSPLFYIIKMFKSNNCQVENHTCAPLAVLEGTDRSLSPEGGPAIGFLPSFKAFLISAAFQAAYFCFCSSCKRT